MREESSRPGDTTGSTYTDLAAVTPEAYAIASTSRNLARERVGNATPEDRIRQRCSIAVGDFAMADLMRFCGDPVAAGLSALARQAPIITDIRMVQAGILKRGHGSKVLCALDYGEDIARERGITRMSAGFVARGTRSGQESSGTPSALLVVCDMIGEVRPALVVGTPVGLVARRSRRRRSAL